MANGTLRLNGAAGVTNTTTTGALTLSVGNAAIAAYAAVFLALVPVLVLAAKFVATRRPIAEVLERWEHILFPIVLIGLGFFILISGGAFGF